MTGRAPVASGTVHQTVDRSLHVRVFEYDERCVATQFEGELF